MIYLFFLFLYSSIVHFFLFLLEQKWENRPKLWTKKSTKTVDVFHCSDHFDQIWIVLTTFYNHFFLMSIFSDLHFLNFFNKIIFNISFHSFSFQILSYFKIFLDFIISSHWVWPNQIILDYIILKWYFNLIFFHFILIFLFSNFIILNLKTFYMTFTTSFFIYFYNNSSHFISFIIILFIWIILAANSEYISWEKTRIII